MPRDHPPCLLLSGGVDSALVARLLVDAGTPPTALFVDYGQPAAAAEDRASSAVAAHFGLLRERVAVTGLSLPSRGEIVGRNDLLLAVAHASAPGRDIALGVHAGTGYADCSPGHRDAWQMLLDTRRRWSGRTGWSTRSCPSLERCRRCPWRSSERGSARTAGRSSRGCRTSDRSPGRTWPRTSACPSPRPTATSPASPRPAAEDRSTTCARRSGHGSGSLCRSLTSCCGGTPSSTHGSARLSPATACRTDSARPGEPEMVGEDGLDVAAVAGLLGVGRSTVMRAVAEYGTPLVEDPGRLAGVVAIGVDETAFLAAGPRSATQFVTGIVARTGPAPGAAARRGARPQQKRSLALVTRLQASTVGHATGDTQRSAQHGDQVATPDRSLPTGHRAA